MCDMGWTGARQQQMKKKAQIMILMPGKEIWTPGKTAYPSNRGRRTLRASTPGVS